MMEMEEERLRMREHVMKNVSLDLMLLSFSSCFHYVPRVKPFSLFFVTVLKGGYK